MHFLSSHVRATTRAAAFCYALLFALTFAGCTRTPSTGDVAPMASSTASVANDPVRLDDLRELARDAYVWGFPIVDNYRVMDAYVLDPKNPEYKGPFNTVANNTRLYTPRDKSIQTPNSDTPYSMVWMDLRAEPIVLTVPKIEKKRYYAIQLIDAYTHNAGYIGSRATGNDAGSYLIAGPGWSGARPAGIKQVFPM